eukprot:GHVU01186125.1.p1 GENE.GHVU01186125.1~~GHVU01186125.1.p1  ORF type:complete len:354 (+),score=62.37 GHVU01186125.1:185-1246(+)
MTQRPTASPAPAGIADAIADANTPANSATAPNKVSTTAFNSFAAATLQGNGEDVRGYGRVGVSIRSDNATDGTLYMEVSDDDVTYSGPPRTWADTTAAQPHMWTIVEPYFRVRYVNGTTEAANLAITVQYSNNSDILLGHQLDETLLDETEAVVTRSVLVAKDDAGTYQNIGAVTKGGRTSQFFAAGYSDTFSVHLTTTLTPNGADVAYMLVDISDTTNWPHTLTGEVVVGYMLVQVDPHANFTGTIRIGYLKNVDATNGDLVVVLAINMDTKSDVLHQDVDFGSHALHCTDTSHFGPVTANSTLFQTDVSLGGPDDPSTLTYPSGAGDLVLVVSGNNNPVGVSITLGYETVA